MTANLRLAFRQLRKSPGFTLTAILTLALGIGANAVVFSVMNAVVLRPVKVPNPRNLYLVQRGEYPSQSYLDYVDLRDRNQTFESLFSYNIIGSVGVDSGRNPSTAWPYLASGNYFDALGIQPYLGRFYHASDEHGKNSAPYIVLSYAYWHSHFQENKGVVGQVLEINKHPFTVIGVAPKDFRGTELFFAPDMWIPLVEQPTVMGNDSLQYRGNHSENVAGRLRPGVTAAQGAADLNNVGGWLAKTYPADDDGVKFSLAHPGLMGDMIEKPARAFMGGLMLLAGLILLAACANLGSLFAARTADRGKETALRLALGSRRGMILRQMLTEAVLVSLAGGAVGLAGSVVILRILSTWQPIPNVPINVPVNPDVLTYVVALVLALGSGLLFGIVPVRQVMRVDPWQAIRAGMSGTAGHSRFSLRDVLLAVQIAICAVLVTSSLVAVRGMARSMHSDFGFDPQNVVIASGDLQMSGHTRDQSPETQRLMLDAAASIPGVTAAGYVDQIPLGLGGSDSFVYADTTTDFRPTNQIADAMDYNISPGYLQAAGTKLLAGRDFAFSDDSKAPKVAIVNREFAVKVFGSVQRAVGGHFKFWGGDRAEVVGVVEDGKYRTLTEDQKPAMFFSFQQHTESGTWILVRSERDPQEISRALDLKLHGVDAALPLVIDTWSQEMSSALFAARVAAVALGVLGLLGAMLAVTGIFGMASYTVSKRLRELGIRMALGAQWTQVLRVVLGRTFILLTAGSLAGIGLGILASKVLAFIVYQAAPWDPVVLGGVVVTMMALGLVAAWVPAQRALAVNPMILMREE